MASITVYGFEIYDAQSKSWIRALQGHSPRDA
jgi:hypothetical protein